MEILRKILNRLILSGIWTIPIAFILLHFVILPDLIGSNDAANSYAISLVISVLIYLWISTDKMMHPSEKDGLKGKDAALNKRINRKLLSVDPKGIILGRSGRYYVRKPLDKDGHVLIIGGSGSGKSSCVVIPTLLANPEASIFAIDIKGELSMKSRKYSDPDIRLFDPEDRMTYGYDPLFRLRTAPSAQKVLETMQLISASLISVPADIKDPFWKTSSRNLLTGLLIYFYDQGKTNFIEIVDEILGRPIRETIKNVMETAPEHTPEYRYLVQFKDMPDETMGGILAEMNNHLQIFANDMDIRYAFKDNPLKFVPGDLEAGLSIFLSVREHKLTDYYDIFQLILNQVLSELEKRPEDSRPVLFIADELPRILSAGKLAKLLDSAKTLRSRKVTLFLIVQSVEALMQAYSENEAMDLISNCPYLLILSATSGKTQKMVADWCGKYRQRRKSWSGNGSKTSVSVSYEERNIIDPSDLMTLQETGKAVLISPYGFSMISKAPYYSDRVLAQRSEEIVALNKTLKGVS